MIPWMHNRPAVDSLRPRYEQMSAILRCWSCRDVNRIISARWEAAELLAHRLTEERLGEPGAVGQKIKSRSSRFASRQLPAQSAGRWTGSLNSLTMASGAMISLDRMVRAVEKVRARLLRSTAALEASGVAYAVAGGNAVAAWVSTVDEGAVRNTQDVDLLIRRADLDAAVLSLEAAGYHYRRGAGIDMFLENPDGRARDAVHIVFAREKVRPDYLAPTPDVDESEATAHFRVVSLKALVRMKLTSFRDKDRMHLRDLLEVGLLDATWPSLMRPPELGQRLQLLIDSPE
jgi:hypothetical protein